MVRDIFDYPPVERPYVAVRRFKLVMGESLFTKLLDYLGCDYGGFVENYGEKLISNPNCLTKDIVDMQHEEWVKIHEQCKDTNKRYDELCKMNRGGACLD